MKKIAIAIATLAMMFIVGCNQSSTSNKNAPNANAPKGNINAGGTPPITKYDTINLSIDITYSGGTPTFTIGDIKCPEFPKQIPEVTRIPGTGGSPAQEGKINWTVNYTGPNGTTATVRIGDFVNENTSTDKDPVDPTYLSFTFTSSGTQTSYFKTTKSNMYAYKYAVTVQAGSSSVRLDPRVIISDG